MNQPVPSPMPESPPGSASAGLGAPASWPWRRAALFLAGAAQLITISALVGADRPPADWPFLLLATAPAVFAALAAFAPSPANLLAAFVGCIVLIAGVIGAWDDTGLFGIAKLWDERS